jgi:Winged helix DNA-binding domain
MIVNARLHNQHLTKSFTGKAADLVAAFAAVQSQEFALAKWGLGLRLRGDRDDEGIETAFTRGHILRTHIMRPTWHFVAPRDITWMLELTAPRVLAATASYFRRGELDSRTLTRATAIVERALSGGNYLTRPELRAVLGRSRIKLSAQQVAFLSLYGELHGVICSGPRRGRHFTYALLSERLSATKTLVVKRDRDEAIAELTQRFIVCHGPATVRDFIWWSGLKAGDARRGLEMIGAKRLEVDGLNYWYVRDLDATRPSTSVQLLPIYDEYLVAYRDRAVVPFGPTRVSANADGPVLFRNALVIDGQIAGTWRTERNQSTLALTITPLRPLRKLELQGIEEEAARFGRFSGVAVTLSIDKI